MNDLRSTSQAIDGGEDASEGITSTPPRVRPERIAERGAKKKMSRRQSIAERARQEAVANAASRSESGDDIDDHDGREAAIVAETIDLDADTHSGTADDEQTLFDDEALNAKLARRASRRSKGEEGPDSRPARRRDVEDDDAHDGEDRFPWHFQFDEDDEPEELQASTPLLSRAFRATTG